MYTWFGAKKKRKEQEQEQEQDEERNYDIERISAQRKVGSTNGNAYLVHWEGFPTPTWEPTKMLANTEALAEWKARPK